MKIITCLSLIASASAFNTFAGKGKKAVSSSAGSFTLDSIPGALPPAGVFDPWNFGGRADEVTLKRYREAELAHGRVAMLAAVGFLVGEYVEGS